MDELDQALAQVQAELDEARRTLEALKASDAAGGRFVAEAAALTARADDVEAELIRHRDLERQLHEELARLQAQPS